MLVAASAITFILMTATGQDVSTAPTWALRSPTVQAEEDGHAHDPQAQDPDGEGSRSEVTGHLATGFTGRVLIDAPAGICPAPHASIRWLVNQEEDEPDVKLEDWHQIVASEDGTFASILQSPGILHYVVRHPLGTQVYGSAHLPVLDREFVLGAAGLVVIHVRGHDGQYRVRFYPVRRGTQMQHKKSLTFSGRGPTLECKGVPADWRQARIELILDDSTTYTQDAPVPVRFNETTHVHFDLLPGPTSIRGYVTQESGAPLSGAFVHAHIPSPSKGEVFNSASTNAGRDGAFELNNLPATKLRLFISHKGYRFFETAIRLQPGMQKDVGQIILDRGYVIQGRVLLSGGTNNGPEVWVGYKKLDLLSDHSIQFFSSRRADPDGSFRFQGVSPGAFVVWAARGSRSISMPWSGKIVHVRDKDADGLTLTLGLESEWRAVIHDARGHDVRGFRMVARGILAPWSAYAHIDDTRILKLNVGRGSFLLGLWGNSGLIWTGVVGPAQESITLPEGELVLHSNSGIHYPPVSISILYVSGQVDRKYLPLRATARTPSEGQRKYILRHLLPGEYRLEAAWQNKHKKEFQFRIPPEASQVNKPWPFE